MVRELLSAFFSYVNFWSQVIVWHPPAISVMVALHSMATPQSNTIPPCLCESVNLQIEDRSVAETLLKLGFFDLRSASSKRAFLQCFLRLVSCYPDIWLTTCLKRYTLASHWDTCLLHFTVSYSLFIFVFHIWIEMSPSVILVNLLWHGMLQRG